jgi:hypothetical protein
VCCDSAAAAAPTRNTTGLHGTEKPKRFQRDAGQGRAIIAEIRTRLEGLAADGLLQLARFGADSIVAVLARCVRWHSPLRLAKRSTDLPGALSVRLLDETVLSSKPQGPHGPELGRAGWPRYVVKFRQRFCIEVRNHSRADLQVMLLNNNVASGGQVQILADSTTSSARWAHSFWLSKLGDPLYLEGPAGFERVVAIGTNRRD